MKIINPSKIELIETAVQRPDGGLEKFYFIKQLLTYVNGEIDWSDFALAAGMMNTMRIIQMAKRQHKAVNHYYDNLSELMRFYEMTEENDAEEDMIDQAENMHSFKMAA